MARRTLGAAAAPVALLIAGLSGPAPAQRAGGAVTAARADLAHMASGTYFGDVISDARGASRSSVRVTVTRAGPNLVRVVSDHPRLPPFTARLGRAMDSLQNVGGDSVFLLDLSKSPRTLMVTIDDASWAGVKE